MERSCPHGTTHLVPQEKFPQTPYNKSFIDQACSVKMAGHWPRSFLPGAPSQDDVQSHPIEELIVMRLCEMCGI